MYVLFTDGLMVWDMGTATGKLMSLMTFWEENTVLLCMLRLVG